MTRLTVVAAAAAALVACGSNKDTADREKLPDPKEAASPGAAQGAGAQPAQPEAPLPALPGALEGAGDVAPLWSEKLGGIGADAARSVAVDKDGNYLVTGYFEDQVDFGAGPVKSAGVKDVFLAKLDRTGKLLWAKRFGGQGEDIGQAVAADSQGNIVVTGSFTDSADFGAGKLFESKGRTDIFIARYTPAGEHLWSTRVGGEVEDRGYAVAIDSADNVIVTGYFGGAIELGGQPLGSAGQADIFVVKYAPSSEAQWSWRIGGELDDLGRSIAVDAQDNIILAGDFNEEISIGGSDLTSAGNADVLLAKFTPEGKHIWSHTFGSFFNDFAVGVAVDDSGHIVMTGSFEQDVDFGGGELKADKKKEIFLAKYTGDGRHLWSKRFGGRDDDVGGSVAVDGHGNIYMAGWFWREVDFGGGVLASAGDNDIVLAKYAPDGSYEWAQRWGDLGADFGRSVAVDANGDAILVGTFRGTINFGGGDLVYAGDKDHPQGDMFIAAFGKKR